ncbi:hypothetical protein N7508_003161 [Penicillium antarcticum]|uniref:uncharacterized protein n=1 Tax=Penicillium antarcticum TaxID=416450 RepID=UPI0023A452D7|nr:uncharacterized protein N7508_003161 [Penicillium antarcticum]KAJ5312331.1 hypothetical protein N7508_003161 [Penicillium antarcticum]
MAKMKEIYASSALTIVVAAAEGIFGGFLYPRVQQEALHTIPVRIRPGFFGIIYITGIASHPSFCNALGPGYFAGQWQYNLARQLTWRTSSRHRTIPENENHALHRSLQYRAPSWSWASLDGGIIHFDFSYDDEDKAAPTMICDILGRLTTPAYLGLKPFGEISSAQVKLHSPVRVAWFNPSTSNIFLLSESTFAKSKSLAPENEAITFEETWQHHMNEFILKHPDVDISGDESEATHGTDFRNMCGTHDEIGCYGSFLVLCVAITMENLTLYPYELEWV